MGGRSRSRPTGAKLALGQSVTEAALQAAGSMAPFLPLLNGERIECGPARGKGVGDGHAAGQRRFIGAASTTGRRLSAKGFAQQVRPAALDTWQSSKPQRPPPAREVLDRVCRRRKLAAYEYRRARSASRRAAVFSAHWPRFSTVPGRSREIGADRSSRCSTASTPFTARDRSASGSSGAFREGIVPSGPIRPAGPIHQGRQVRAPGRRLARTVAGLSAS